MRNEKEEALYGIYREREVEARKRTVYDGIRITKKGLDRVIGVLSIALIILLVLALLK